MKKWTIIALCLFLSLGAGYISVQKWMANWAPERVTFPIQGVFLLGNEGHIDWHILNATGVDFIYIRATSGDLPARQSYTKARNAAIKANLQYGIVHDYNICSSASDQANNFITQIARTSKTLPPVIRFTRPRDCDILPTRSALISEFVTFLNQVENHLETRAILSIGKSVENHYAITQAFPNHTYWMIRNYFEPIYGAKEWVIWQANEARRVQGIEKKTPWLVIRSFE